MDIKEMNEEATEAMKDIEDPYEYLDALEENYRDFEEREGVSFDAHMAKILSIAKEEGVTLEQVAAFEDLTLKEWLDKQQALYRQDGAAAGVAYVDEIDEDREHLQQSEDKLWAAVEAIEEATQALEAGTEVSLHLAAEAADDCASAVRKLTDLKLSMDKMEEIPNFLQSLYKATMKAMTSAGKASQDAYNAQMQARKAANKR